MRLLVATHSPGKLAEYQALLDDLDVRLTSLREEGIGLRVEEGEDYEQNARRKARGYARLAGLWTLADDSGLEIQVMGGAPGPHSARFLGPEATDEERWAEVLRRLADVPWEERKARFVCVLALSSPPGEVETFLGEVHGFIATQARGRGGFGYDPIFWLPEHQATMAELGQELKNRLSHRARAVQAARPRLRFLTGAGSGFGQPSP